MCGTSVPQAVTVAAQGLQHHFYKGVELWNRKYSIYKNVRVCTFVRVIYIHTFSWKFLKNLFHGSTVDLYPLWHKAFKCGTQVPHCSTVPRFLEENYGTKAISSRMY